MAESKIVWFMVDLSELFRLNYLLILTGQWPVPVAARSKA